MGYTFSNGVLTLPDKGLTILDRLVLDFLSRVKIQYVIVSGYVAILFGRSRNTEDIDMFIRDEGVEAFTAFYDKVVEGGRFYAINAESANDAYELMTVDKSSLRFAEKGTFDPNFEIRFAGKDTDFYSMKNAWLVDLGGKAKIRISPMELEIAYKLYLGSEKDLDDAAHLYVMFKAVLDVGALRSFLDKLDINMSVAKKILDDSI